MTNAEHDLAGARAVPGFDGACDPNSNPWTTSRQAMLRLLEETNQKWAPEEIATMFAAMVYDVLRPDERVDCILIVDMLMDVKPKKIGKLPLDRGGPGIVVFTEQRLVAACAYSRRGQTVRDVQSVPLNGSVDCNIATFKTPRGLESVLDLPFPTGLLRFVPSEQELGRDTFELWVAMISERVAGTFAPEWVDGVFEGLVEIQ